MDLYSSHGRGIALSLNMASSNVEHNIWPSEKYRQTGIVACGYGRVGCPFIIVFHTTSLHNVKPLVKQFLWQVVCHGASSYPFPTFIQDDMINACFHIGKECYHFSLQKIELSCL